MEYVDSLKACFVFIGPREGLESPLQKIPFESQKAPCAISCSWGSSFPERMQEPDPAQLQILLQDVL